MGIKCDEFNHVCVVTVDGDFVAAAASHLRRAADERITQRQVVDFVIDLEKSGFVDSEGLETLLWLKRRSEDLFGRVKLVNLDDNCRKIFEMTRLVNRFECHADLPSALKTMR